MIKVIKIWCAPPPRTYKRVLLMIDSRNFLYYQNWGFSMRSLSHFGITTPMFLMTKCNGQFRIGLGNVYLLFGW